GPPPSHVSMSPDLKAFCRDLQDRLGWLSKEVARLQEDNERLQQENKSLREEVTLARLFRDIEPAPEGPRPAAPPDELFDAPPSVSREAMEFYHHLPPTFNFADFFQVAEQAG